MIVGIGCDLCKIQRVNLTIAQKILTPSEIIEFNLVSDKRKQEWLAGRFAAKEAMMKAAGIKKMSELEITTVEGKPVGRLLYQGYKVFLTITHDGDYAMAMAVVESD